MWVKHDCNMRPIFRRSLWLLSCAGLALSAIPWRVLLGKLSSSSTCALAPVFDPISLLGLPTILDLEHLSRHAQALTTAMMTWAVLAHLFDGRTAAFTPILLAALLLQPLAWIGSSTCVSLEVPLPSDALRPLYPFQLFDVDRLLFVTDPPTALVAWAAMCLYGASELRAARRGLAVFVCVFIGVYATVVRRTTASQLICTFILANLLSRPHKLGQPALTAADDVPPLPDARFRVTEEDETAANSEEEDEEEVATTMPATDGQAMMALVDAAGGRLPETASDQCNV